MFVADRDPLRWTRLAWRSSKPAEAALIEDATKHFGIRK
jgi:hypothetical protein